MASKRKRSKRLRIQKVWGVYTSWEERVKKTIERTWAKVFVLDGIVEGWVSEKVEW